MRERAITNKIVRLSIAHLPLNKDESILLNQEIIQLERLKMKSLKRNNLTYINESDKENGSQFRVIAL